MPRCDFGSSRTWFRFGAAVSKIYNSYKFTNKYLKKNINFSIINCKNGDNKTEEFIKINPQHTIPVLDDNGVIIVDSHVICCYLADKYAKNDDLYPKDLVKRCEVQTRLFFDCGHLFARIRSLFEPVIYFGAPDLPAEKVEYIVKTYDAVENYLKNGEYLCGSKLTIADLCCLASLSSIEKIAPIDSGKFPRFTKWLETLKKLPYYKAANGEGAEVLQSFVLQTVEENKKKL